MLYVPVYYPLLISNKAFYLHIFTQFFLFVYTICYNKDLENNITFYGNDDFLLLIPFASEKEETNQNK